ncbi:hypothetical protein FBQ79_12975, partial [Anaerolineae bacterium AMX1]|nr:hypothetical protein [Anaerolineae bacterium AMX1]
MTMKIRFTLTFCLLAVILTGCRSPQLGGNLSVTVKADGAATRLEVQTGTTAAQALEQAEVLVGSLDIVEPPLYTVLNDGDEVRVTRVAETFVTEQAEIPFEKRIARSEAVPEGETRLLTPGQNGLQELTWRVLTEDGEETSRTVVKTVVLKEAVAEITMVGAQSAFAPLPIPGRLALLAGGSAWIMDGTTGIRKPLVATGDLDGRVFALSPKGDYLLYTRKSQKPPSQQINTLWVVRTNGQSSPQPVSGAANVVHFAGWAPTTTPKFAYSTVEPRPAAPGWQANNDLYIVTMAGSLPNSPHKIIEANSGGLYGWWGMSYAWGSDGRLVYVRPEEMGIVDQETGLLRPMLDITPLQTNSDWAWIPPLGWSPEARTIYIVTHAPAPAPLTAEGSPYFDLTAVSMINDATARMAQNVGMFAYPSASPVRMSGKERSFQVAPRRLGAPRPLSARRFGGTRTAGRGLGASAARRSGWRLLRGRLSGQPVAGRLGKRTGLPGDERRDAGEDRLEVINREARQEREEENRRRKFKKRKLHANFDHRSRGISRLTLERQAHRRRPR